MKLTHANYCATVVELPTHIPLAGCDNVVGVSLFGYQAIVSKDTVPGSLGLVFTAETQLSHEFCRANNLYRDPLMNSDPTQKGYFESNRRVRAMKFRGHKSSAFFVPLTYLGALGLFDGTLKVGDSFNEINGVEICTKYIPKTNPAAQPKNKVRGKKKFFDRVEPKNFPEHIETNNYYRNKHRIEPDQWVTVTQKLHGTSGRWGHIPVKRKLTWIERLAKFFGAKVQEIEYDYIAGSRRVVKDPATNRNHVHYYKDDIWNEYLNKISHSIPKNYIIYGEIIGYVGDSIIQKGYGYGMVPHINDLYIYRVSIVNEDGLACDLGWEQMTQFCTERGLNFVPIVTQGYFGDIEPMIEEMMDKRLAEQLDYAKGLVELDADSPCDEGVCVRVEAIQPYILKAKFPLFFEHETKQLDKGEVDIETEQTVSV